MSFAGYEKPLLTLASGIMAGLGTTISLVCVPAILATSDPLSGWRTLYKRGSKIAITCCLIANFTGIRLYMKSSPTDNLFLLALSTLPYVAIPAWTIAVMKSTNDTLHSIYEGKREEKKDKILELVEKWAGMQWVRTILGVVGFVGTIWFTQGPH